MNQVSETLLREEVVKKVKAIVIDALHAQKMANQITEETYLENIGLDSLNIVDVLLGIETEFAIAFDEDELDLEPLESIGTLATYVLENKAAGCAMSGC